MYIKTLNWDWDNDKNLDHHRSSVFDFIYPTLGRLLKYVRSFPVKTDIAPTNGDTNGHH